MGTSFTKVRTQLIALILLAEIPALYLILFTGLNHLNVLFLAMFSALALIASWYIGTLFVERWIRPLLTVARKLGMGDRSVRTGLPYRKDELGTLAKAIDEMAESLEHLPKQTELILNSLGNGVISLDVKGRVTYANPAALKTLGFEIDELKGKSLHALTHHTKLDGEPYPEKDCPIFRSTRDGATHV